MADTTSAASVVVVDPVHAAAERHRLAQKELSEDRLSQVMISGVQFTIPYTLRYCTELGSSDMFLQHKEKVRTLVEDEFKKCDALFNRYNPRSEISRVNALQMGRTHTMSAEFKHLMQHVVGIVRSSGGSFDPCAMPVADLLCARIRTERQRFDRYAQQDSRMERLAEERRFWEKVDALAKVSSFGASFAVDFGAGTIQKKVAEARMDLGGVAKGHAVDEVVRTLRRNGIENLLVEWGGDVKASGRNIKNEPWKVGILRPPSLGELLDESRKATSATKHPPAGTEAAAAAAVTGGASGASGTAAATWKQNVEASASYLKVVPLDDEALASSGDYRNVLMTRDRFIISRMAAQSHGGQQTAHLAHAGSFIPAGPAEQPDDNTHSNSNSKEQEIEQLAAHDTIFTTHYNWKRRALVQAEEYGVAQITVKCTSCLYADALATAAFVKRHMPTIRGLLENWRYTKFPVTDFVAYQRHGELMAGMNEIGRESHQMKVDRVKLCVSARVIVVGGGLAGLCAAIEAYRCHASVVILEKSGKLGGNSAKATSGINGWGTRAQGAIGEVDASKFFERDTFFSALGGSSDKSLVKMLSVKSREAIQWLTREFDLPLSVLSQLGGHSRKRTHRAPDQKNGTPVPIGYTIMQHLIDHINKHCNDRITVFLNCHATELMHSNEEMPDNSLRHQVHGVKYVRKDTNNRSGSSEKNAGNGSNGHAAGGVSKRSEAATQPPAAPAYDTTTQTAGYFETLQGDAVILTTGGFGNDRDPKSSLLKEFAPHLMDVPTTNGDFSTGDGVKMCRDVSALLVDMDKIQLHPTGLIDPKDPTNATKYLGPEALRGSGGILLNGKGERFVNELDLRSVVSKAIQQQNDVYEGSNGCKFAYCVLNANATKLFGVNSLDFYKNKLGLFRDASDVNELATLMNVPAATLTETLQEYGGISTAAVKTNGGRGMCPKTHKTVYPCIVDPAGPFVVAVVTPSIHYTMGGVSISASAEVQCDCGDEGVFGRKRSILGLFAAGEVTGGLHGSNRLGGNSLLECVVFGRIAGDRAATILQKSRNGLTSDWAPVVLREYREGGAFGHGSRVLRFNLNGAHQVSGLKLGQFIAMRGEWDGQQLVGYYSPITLPHDYGVIGVLVRIDKGALKEWLAALQPGDAVYMKACGGLAIDRIPSIRSFVFEGRPLRRLGMIAGGTGVAPMLQLLRAALKKPYNETFIHIDLVYASESEDELTYANLLQRFVRDSGGKFRCHFVVNNPPLGWVKGVGFITKAILQEHIFQPHRVTAAAAAGAKGQSGGADAAAAVSNVITSKDDTLIALCGPPVMQRIVKSTLIDIGHDASVIRTVDEQPADSKL